MSIQRRRQNWRDSLDARDADAVVRGKIAQTVGDQSILVTFHAAHDVRPVTDNEISARIDDAASEPDDVTARFTGEPRETVWQWYFKLCNVN